MKVVYVKIGKMRKKLTPGKVGNWELGTGWGKRKEAKRMQCVMRQRGG